MLLTIFFKKKWTNLSGVSVFLLLFSNSPFCQAELSVQRIYELQQSPLKIGSDCEPTSWTTKLNPRTLNETQTKYFWLGQRYAVERRHMENLAHQKRMQVDNSYEDQIAALEQKRHEASLASLGIKPFRSPEADRAIAENDRVLKKIQAQLDRSSQEWAVRCFSYTDARSR